MMTELLYLKDSYLKAFGATVVQHDIEQNGVLLDRTRLSGRRRAIAGSRRALAWIGAISRQRVKRGNAHIIDGDMPPIGSQVRGEIDWDRRYKIMRTHTAMHILCGVIWRDYQASVTGGNMDVLGGRMDFEFERLAPEVIAEIEEKINREVEAARAVKIEILPREKAFQIPDLIRTKSIYCRRAFKRCGRWRLLGWICKRMAAPMSATPAKSAVSGLPNTRAKAAATSGFTWSLRLDALFASGTGARAIPRQRNLPLCQEWRAAGKN